MTKVHSTAVVIIPPKEVWGEIQDIRKKYDRHIHRWMPHITLLYPFRPQSEFNNLKSLFLTTCKKIEIFDIFLKKFKYFHHGKQKYTLYLDPESETLIAYLQHKILEIIPDCNDVTLYRTGFLPHLSVGQIEGKDNLKVNLKNLQINWNPLKFKITSIYFIAREKDKLSEFKIKKEISLKLDSCKKNNAIFNSS
ncbi:MAG: 2'-5' RNA ligase family protein [Candidatus Lokiarchaeota archaeon]|nr:2'-5' RNA ligase family protein [Candidatus Lokiarchaeota archaeon]